MTFDFVANEWGLTLGSGSGATADAGNVTEITKDDVVLTFDKATASTHPRMWTGPQLRLYKGNTMTVAAPTGKQVSAVVISTTTANNYGFSSDGVEVDRTAGWSGAATSVTFDCTKNSNVTAVTVTLTDEGTVTPEPGPTPQPEYATIYQETFASSLGEFTTNDATADDIDVWTYNSRYSCAVGSGYVSSTRYDTESWLISPVISLKDWTDVQLLVDQAANYFSSQENFQADAAVKVRVAGTEEWADLTFDVYPAGNSYTFVTTTADLSAYDGQDVQIAFVYTSTTERAGTWELQNFLLQGTPSASYVDVEEPTITPAEGSYLANVEVTISTTQSDLSIYYTTDGSRPAVDPTQLYTGPFTLTADAVVSAIAADAAGNVSDVVTASYTIRQPLEVPDGCVGFDFVNNPWGLPVSSGSDSYQITEVTQDDVVLTLTTAEGVTDTRLWQTSNGTQLRIYKNSTMTFTAPAKFTIVKIEFGAGNFYLTTDTPTLTDRTWEGDAQAVTFTSTGTSQINTAIVTLKAVAVGIDGATIESAAPKAIYTLDGRRVSRAERGLYIIDGQKVYVK